ncbi:MAG TPA: hypothetical protein VE692_07320, partial [Nitrososphaera sp.]|nr:hypothetical protein [Nitrososphaera sp.]
PGCMSYSQGLGQQQAHLFVCGLTLCHMDAILRRQEAAQRFWVGNVEAELAIRGIELMVPSAESGRKL